MTGEAVVRGTDTPDAWGSAEKGAAARGAAAGNSTKEASTKSMVGVSARGPEEKKRSDKRPAEKERATSWVRCLRPTMKRRVLTYACPTILSVFMTTPWLWMSSTSFKRSRDVLAPGTRLVPDPVSTRVYERVFTGQPFLRYFPNSVIVAVIVVIPNAIFDSLTAYAFAGLPFLGWSFLFSLLMMAMMIPMRVSLIPLYRMVVWLHGWVLLLGLGTLSGTTASGVVQVFGIFLIRQFFAPIPDSILGAARLDGASEFQILWRIVLPFAAPGIVTLAASTFLEAWNDFPWPLLVSNFESTRTLPVDLVLLARKNTVDWSGTMAGAVATTVPMIVIFIVT